MSAYAQQGCRPSCKSWCMPPSEKIIWIWPSSFFLMVCAPSSPLGFGEVGAGGSPGGHQETWDECSGWGSPVRASDYHFDQSLVNRLFAHHPRNGASCKTSRSGVGTMGSVLAYFLWPSQSTMTKSQLRRKMFVWVLLTMCQS